MTTAIELPETPGQARTWHDTKRGYLRLGLCHTCAAQAAYGHAHGFTHVQPPCTSCTLVTSDFGISAPNGWRKATRAALRSAPETAGRFPHLSDPGRRAAVPIGAQTGFEQ